MSKLSSERQQIYTQLLQDFDKVKARNLSLNIARGKPSKEQLDLSNAMLHPPEAENTVLASGEDARNYGGDPQGIAEIRALFSPILGVPPEQIIAGGNSSLGPVRP